MKCGAEFILDRASYSSCGCAGGEVATLTDEGTVDAGVTKRRQQKIYSDFLGRKLKNEVLNWQGGAVYATTVNSYNQLDQVTQIRQYAGAEGSGNTCVSDLDGMPIPYIDHRCPRRSKEVGKPAG